mgnify:CR=1 FL=1
MSESASRQAQAGATASPSRAQPRRKAEPAVGGEMGGEMAAVQALGTRSGNRAVSGLATGGVPLPAEVLQDMETRFGETFGQVRTPDSPQAHASAAALHAKAYTRGQDIVFGLHRYAPRTSLGKRLLAHELAHVVQQRRGGAAPVLDAQASHEQAAGGGANAVAGGPGPPPLPPPAPSPPGRPRCPWPAPPAWAWHATRTTAGAAGCGASTARSRTRSRPSTGTRCSRRPTTPPTRP